jgi:hypothetical protein
MLHPPTNQPRIINEMSSTIPQNALDTPPHTPPPLRQGTVHLTRDQRRDIRLMHDLHHSDAEIIQRFTITQRQLDYTIQAARPTPRKPPGRRGKLKDPEIDILIAYMTSSAHTRRMTFKTLAKDPHLNLHCSPNAIKHALHKRGYNRRLARHKPTMIQAWTLYKLHIAYILTESLIKKAYKYSLNCNADVYMSINIKKKGESLPLILA